MQNQVVAGAKCTIDHILDCAVTLSWNELTLKQSAEGMQIEYLTDTNHALDCLKVWTSATRGHWLLVCEYWMHPSNTHKQGITYSNAYSSSGLTSMLEVIMQNQAAFTISADQFPPGLVEVAPPGETQTIAARTEMRNALERINPHSSTGTIAAAMRFASDHPAASEPANH